MTGNSTNGKFIALKPPVYKVGRLLNRVSNNGMLLHIIGRRSQFASTWRPHTLQTSFRQDTQILLTLEFPKSYSLLPYKLLLNVFNPLAAFGQ